MFFLRRIDDTNLRFRAVVLCIRITVLSTKITYPYFPALSISYASSGRKVFGEISAVK